MTLGLRFAQVKRPELAEVHTTQQSKIQPVRSDKVIFECVQVLAVSTTQADADKALMQSLDLGCDELFGICRDSAGTPMAMLMCANASGVSRPESRPSHRHSLSARHR